VLFGVSFCDLFDVGHLGRMWWEEEDV